VAVWRAPKPPPCVAARARGDAVRDLRAGQQGSSRTSRSGLRGSSRSSSGSAAAPARSRLRSPRGAPGGSGPSRGLVRSGRTQGPQSACAESSTTIPSSTPGALDARAAHQGGELPLNLLVGIGCDRRHLWGGRPGSLGPRLPAPRRLVTQVPGPSPGPIGEVCRRDATATLNGCAFALAKHLNERKDARHGRPSRCDTP
jgi:hypothetical protein